MVERPVPDGGQGRKVSSRRFWILILATLGISEALGLLAGWWFYRLLPHVVPQSMSSTAITLGATQLFLTRGALLGVVLFVWTLAVLLGARLLR
ncbi:MAG TPA: hypothetical protein VJS92_02310 [Candidatus Polarisedimenticolaceae bacterium]|nr:hypothetical protein [Candidatus Polarisedimenticolaceae bacterium]